MAPRIALATLVLLVPLTCSGRGPKGTAPIQPAATADSLLAVRFVAAARSADPVLCDLATRTLDQGWWHDGPTIAIGVRQDPAVNEVVEWSLSARGDADAVAVLTAALADADPCVRQLSARVLGRLDTPAGVTALERALRSESPTTRTAAALGLGVAEDPDSVAALVAMLSDGEAEVRAAAAWALGRVENPAAIEPLIALLSGDDDASVREAAAWALGEIE